jgi:membrane-bound lytic murein transglycosylase F
MPIAAQRLFANTKQLCVITLLVLLTAITACSNKEENIQQQGTLKVITRNGPSTYYVDKNGPTGFEYELVKLFAEHLGVKLEITATHSLDEIFALLKNNDAHIAAAGLTITPERQQFVQFSPPYMDIKQYVIYRSNKTKPKSAEDILNSNILILADSSHDEILQQLGNLYPELNWRGARDLETTDLLDMLDEGVIDYTIIDSNEYTANKGFYPHIKIGFEIGQPGQLAWAMSKQANNPTLETEMARFFDKIQEDGTLRQLKERFFTHNEQIKQIDSKTFNKAVKRKLPKYEPLIKKVAGENNIDWHLLAAISYQESHWNPKAKSPTGVRGIMMLTQMTAKEMKVSNRIDAEQSLRGGARYFNKILKRIPQHIQEPDRTWMALAAYNVGMGHVEDARIITQNQGKDPNKWTDVKDHLPLLRKRKWYKKTKYGYARGNEPVTYVQNIRHYYELLSWADLSKDRIRPPQNMEQYLPETLQQEFNAL